MTDNGEKTYLREQNTFFKWLTPSLLVLVGGLLVFIWQAQVETIAELRGNQQDILAAQRITNAQLSAMAVEIKSNRRD
ncbi:MAG: hypothetical protein P1R58_11715, partial [bacterium]|nr:hypothetical protein [bacterium]